MKQFYCVHIFLFFIVCLNLNLQAQNNCQYSFSGRVIDLDDGKELESTFVILQESNQTQITNEHGSFKFNNLCEGNYQFIIRHIGCKDTVISVNISKDTKLNIKLPHSAVELSQIDVMDKQPDIIKTQTVDEIKSKDLDSTRGQSLGESLKLINTDF